MNAALAEKESKARAPRTGPTESRTDIVGRPANFPRLQGFFASQTALANALGVHRDTIRKWDRGEATRLRRSSVEGVLVMSAVAEQVARYMPNDASVGSWLGHPQPALGGKVPTAMVRKHGRKAYAVIVRAAAAVAEPMSVGDLDGMPEEHELLPLMREEFGDRVTERVGSLAPGAEDPDADPDFLASLTSDARPA